MEKLKLYFLFFLSFVHLSDDFNQFFILILQRTIILCDLYSLSIVLERLRKIVFFSSDAVQWKKLVWFTLSFNFDLIKVFLLKVIVFRIVICFLIYLMFIGFNILAFKVYLLLTWVFLIGLIDIIILRLSLKILVSLFILSFISLLLLLNLGRQLRIWKLFIISRLLLIFCWTISLLLNRLPIGDCTLVLISLFLLLRNNLFNLFILFLFCLYILLILSLIVSFFMI